MKPPTKVGGASKAAGSAKKGAGAEVDLGPAVSTDEDPIGAALQARNAAGGLSSQIKEADAKKQKLFIPAPLNLKCGSALL